MKEQTKDTHIKAGKGGQVWDGGGGNSNPTWRVRMEETEREAAKNRGGKSRVLCGTEQRQNRTECTAGSGIF